MTQASFLFVNQNAISFAQNLLKIKFFEGEISNQKSKLVKLTFIVILSFNKQSCSSLLQKHEVPLSAIPCFHYQKMKEKRKQEEEKKKEETENLTMKV